MNRSTANLIYLAGLILGVLLAPSVWSQSPNLRESPLVNLAKKVEPCTACIITQNPDGSVGFGSGFVIHPQGYLLTNFHVVGSGNGYVLLNDGELRPFRLVGESPERDLAIVKVNTDRDLDYLPMGRSDDVMLAEPVMVAGNPGGRGIVVTSGIVSAKTMVMDANAVIMAQFKSSRRDGFIQFDAAADRGNSGGPLMNMEGKVIGIVSARASEQNVGFAIPIDRVRELFSDAIAAEVRNDFWIGIDVDPFQKSATISKIHPNSPADKAGLKMSETIVSINGRKLNDACDYYLAIEQIRNGQNVSIEVRNHETDMQRNVTLTANTYPRKEVTNVDAAQVAGLRYSIYETPRLTALPDFDKLKPISSGIATDLNVAKIAGARADDYAIVYEGFLSIDEDQLYRVTIVSDDGSLLELDGETFIDHDGTHPAYARSKLARMKPGLHKIRIKYFESIGDNSLQLSIRKLVGKQSLEIPVLFSHSTNP